MMNENQPSLIWLAADYHFPATYSCRVAMSSMNCCPIVPTPGPATIRLALVRTGIELFGFDWARDELFPVVRSAVIRVRPPFQIGITEQKIRAYKASEEQGHANIQLTESPIYRETAHTMDTMTIYVKTAVQYSQAIFTLFKAIGYWGQSHSFTQCTWCDQAIPRLSECAMSLNSLSPHMQIQNLVVGLVTEFRNQNITWGEIMMEKGKESDAIRPEVYIWPMQVIEQHGGSRLLRRYSIWNASELP